MENFMNFVINDALIVVPVLLVLGQIIKQTPNVPNWVIPYILLAIGVLTTVGILGVSVDAAIQGVLVSGAAVFGNQLWQQGKQAIDQGGK